MNVKLNIIIYLSIIESLIFEFILNKYLRNILIKKLILINMINNCNIMLINRMCFMINTYIK